jgi:glutaconate CoA-transferase, subunit B
MPLACCLGGDKLATRRAVPQKGSMTDRQTSAEFMIAAIARMLEGLSHVAVGAQSPIPGSAALLAQARSGGAMRVSILGSTSNNPFTDGGKELFDAAGQGRIDAFFLSGGQIDGAANVNLVGVGDIADYPKASPRFSGSFGSAYLYFVVPRVILFREEHTPRVLVDKVDFVSAPGVSPKEVYRPGGPYGLVTPLCVFSFDKAGARFKLKSLHPGISAADVRAATGFDYDEADHVDVTPTLDAASLTLLRGDVARRVAETYPTFAKRIWGIGL